MKKIEKIVDERQEQELYKAEHYGFCMMLFVLVITIIIETYFMGGDFKIIGGEIIVLLIGSITEIVATVKQGNWDYHYKPGIKSYLWISFIAGIGMTAVMVLGNAYRYENFRNNFAKLVLPIALIDFFEMFILFFAALAFTGWLSKKQKKRLEEEFDEEEKPDEKI